MKTLFIFFLDIGCQNKNVVYTGTASVTSSGLLCQMWTANSPQNHNFHDVGRHNYCRNPSNDTGGVWCFTTDKNKKWEYCAVPDCATGDTWFCFM